jgi:hypothetical protein
VSRRHPGLGRRLGVAAWVAVLLPVLAALAAGWLHELTGEAGLIAVRDGTLRLSGFITGAAVLSLILSAVAAGMPLKRPRPAVLEAGPAGLRIAGFDRERAIPRASIRDGLILPGYPARLTIWLAGGDLIEAEIPTETHGARLLAALGIGPEQRRVAVSLWSTTNQIAAGFGVVPASMLLWWMMLQVCFPEDHGDGLVAPLWLLGVVLTSALAWRAARPARVIVGRDGVRIERSFWTRWFPHTAIEGVQAEGSRLQLWLRGARPIALEGRADLVDVLARQIRDAQARGAGGASSGTAALERQGRPIPVWREALSGLLGAESGYRTVALTPEDVIAALEDPVAPRDRRIGAALALAAAGHPEARERIRVAAETSADEEMRTALAQAAEEALDEAALERALR